MQFEGSTAFVTGGAHGLGRAIVEAFAAQGVSGSSLDVDTAGKDLPEGWQNIPGDVTVEQDVRSAMAACAAHSGRLDIVVANAGLVPPWRETEHLDMDEWDAVFGVNVRGVAATIKHAVPWMKACGGAVIVMGSLNSQRGHARQCLYTATKHAVLGIVRSAAQDLGRYGIRVNAIGPGPIATTALRARLTGRAAAGHPPPESVLDEFARQTPLGRIATARNVADTAVYLVSDRSGGMSGQLLAVDGGLT